MARHLVSARAALPSWLKAALLLVLLQTPLHASETPSLDIGEAPPGLQPMAWIKGEPIDVRAPGRVRVVLFFASWCGASRQALGELSELARAHAGEVDFVGVNVREAEHGEATVQALRRFVVERGQGLDFGVAMDDPEKTPLFDQWMRAAGTYPTPTAFIIGREGRINYMGFPIDTRASYLFENALRDTLADQPDLAAARVLQREVRVQVSAYLESRRLMRPILEARQAADPAAMLAAIDVLVRDRPDYADRVTHYRLEALLHVDEAAALAFARQLHDETGEDAGDPELHAARVGSLGRSIAAVQGLSPVAYDRAERYLRTALQSASEGYGALLDWLALAELYRYLQRFDEAAEAQARAVALARTTREIPAEALPALERQLSEDRQRMAGREVAEPR